MEELRGEETLLRFRERTEPDPAKHWWVPALHYDVVRIDKMESVGSISLRLGYTTSLVRYGGNIGYGIDEQHRGNRFAAKACKLLLSVAKSHGMDVIWITCNPDNLASRRTCEILGATLVEIVDLPPDNEQYEQGDRQKCRFRLIVY